MKDATTLLDELRSMMNGFVGQTFTEEMRQRIRMDATELMNTADSEGQSKMMPWVCANVNTSFCRQCEDEKAIEDYDSDVCRECHLEGGFTI